MVALDLKFNIKKMLIETCSQRCEAQKSLKCECVRDYCAEGAAVYVIFVLSGARSSCQLCLCSVDLKLAGGWCGWSGWTLVVSLKAELEIQIEFVTI